MIEGGTTGPLAPTSVVIEQRNGRFEPDLVVVPVGSTVQFPNADPIFTMCFPFPHTAIDRLLPKGQSRTVTFKKSGTLGHAISTRVCMRQWWSPALGLQTFRRREFPGEYSAGHYRVIAAQSGGRV
jgi:hypothetical protein